MNGNILQDYLTRAETAKELGTSPRTLIRWEERREGPPATRIGRRVYYNKDSLKKWVSELEQNYKEYSKG